MPLADTDLDIISKSGKNTYEKQSSIPDNSSEVKGAKQSSIPEVTQTALKLNLTLPASCYATMAIRELLKSSTSV